MTVAELRKLLFDIEDQDALVVMSKDAEGNNYSPFRVAHKCDYMAENTWSGYILDEGEHISSSISAVALFPVN